MDRPPAAAAALRWLEKVSLPISEVGKPQHARAVLDAISVTQDGRAASATTIARKRSVFGNVVRYAVELEELPSNPLDRLSWKPPKISEVVDRRVVVNPRQARELLTAVTYVGQQRRGPHARGQRLMALYACMYFAALRADEAVALRRQDRYLPATGWGRLTLEKSRPEGIRQEARALFDASAAVGSPYPQAMAFAALGAAGILRRWPGHAGALALLAAAGTVIGEPAADAAWPWPAARQPHQPQPQPGRRVDAGDDLRAPAGPPLGTAAPR